jgi:3'(2'), 5'-bisphosphate nucleotidase
MSEMSMNFPHPLMAPVVELALQAGDAILPFWRAGVEVTAKSDDSPVTAADIAAHHVIVAGLTALDPSIPVLSEEDANIAQNVRAGWQRWWLVDPLDGTKEFISGSEEFTVNIALIENGRWYLAWCRCRPTVVSMSVVRVSAHGAATRTARHADSGA